MSSANSSERWPFLVTVPVGTQSATITLPALYVRKKSRVKNVMYTDQAGITKDGTNYFTLSLQDTAGTPNVYASLTTINTTGVTLTANIAQSLVLGGTGVTVIDNANGNQEVEVPAATQLQLVVTKHGTGVPTGGLLQLEMYSL